MITSGISTACLYPKLLENALYELAIRNVDLVEIFFNTHSELEKGFVNQLKSIIDSHGMKVSSIHPYTCGIEPMMFFTQYDRRYLDILDYYKKYFEVMNLLDAKIFVFHGNKLQNPVSDELYFERYKGLYDLGKQYGITVAQENVSRCTSGDLDFLIRMSKALGDSAKFVFDTKQAVRKGYNPYEFLDKIGDKIVHIHLSDHSEKGDCQLIGLGNLEFDKFVNKLIDISFTGSIILELYCSGYKHINDLSENLFYFRDIINYICDISQN